MRSFDRLTDPTALGVQPRHLVLVRTPRAMNLEEFNRLYPSAVKIEVIGAINAIEPGATIPAGTMMKRVP